MARQGYVTFALPKELIDEVDKIINKQEFGFRSRTEFIKDSVRRLILDLDKMQDKNEDNQDFSE